MEKVVIGKYVKTHGIKGEIKIRSNFKYKERVFKVGNKVIIENQEMEIASYRRHQEYDMITLKGINDINEILPLKGSLVYVLKSSLNLDEDEYLDSDLIGLNIYMNDQFKGIVTDINYITNNKKLLVVNGNYIPFELIKKIDFKNQKIMLEEVDGLL